MRILRALGIGLLVLVVLAALTPVVALVQRAHARHAAAEDTRDRISADLPMARRDVARRAPRQEGLAERRWGPARAVFEDLACRLDGVEVGLSATAGSEGCQVRRLALFAVARIPADAWPASAPDRCRVVPLAGAPAPGGLAGALRAGAASGCPDGILAPDPDTAVRLLSGRRPTSLAGSPAWVMVTTIHPLPEIDLPCQPWSFLGCDSPLDRPVLPDA